MDISTVFSRTNRWFRQKTEIDGTRKQTNSMILCFREDTVASGAKYFIVPHSIIWRPTGKELTKLQFRGVQTFKPGPFPPECSDRAGTGFNRKVRNFCIEALNNFFFQFQKKFFSSSKKMCWHFFSILDFGKVFYSKSYRIYYRKPYQNPISKKNVNFFFSSSKKKFFRNWKKSCSRLRCRKFLTFRLKPVPARSEHSGGNGPGLKVWTPRNCNLVSSFPVGLHIIKRWLAIRHLMQN